MKMFKKSLIAASVAAVATTAVAGTITANSSNKIALEGAVAAGTIGIITTSTTEVKNDIQVVLTPAADYIVNDVVEFYIQGGTIEKVGASDPTVTVQTVDSDSDSANTTLNFLDMDTSEGKIRFRVQGDNVVAGSGGSGTLTLENVAIDSSNFSDGTTITARAQAVSSASAIGVYDKSSAQTVGVVNDQYSASFSDSFDQTIDVNNSRKLFDKDASGADDTSGGAYDTVALAITDDVSGTNYSITPTSIVHTINAEDLGYAMAFDANEDGELSSGELCGTSTSSFITLTPSVTCAIDGNKLTITDSNSTTSVSLQFNAPGTSASQTLTPQSFTASVDVKGTVSGVSGTQTASAASSASAGSWDLNGASVYVPYMPYASGLSQIIYVSNKGSQSGEIEVTAFDDAGNEYGPYDLGTAGAKDITKITGGLEDALAADGFTSGKLAFTVTVTAPSNSIEVYTGYNAGNDRGLVINSSNR